jgi:SAM-dependent methyltransferase
MKAIDQRAELQRYYEDRDVVGAYMQRRTGQPLNGVLHRSQVRFLNRVLAARGPRAVLEIACGPGRLTAEIQRVQLGVAIDTSPGMLETAKQRSNGGSSRWSFLRTDAFTLPFRSAAFDAVYTLRFVRHFQLAERRRLYDEVRRVLRPRGAFIVDALNYDVSYLHRVKRGLERYPVYDVLYRRNELEAELQAAGFQVVAVEGIIKHFSTQRMLNRLRRVKLDSLASVLIAALERVPGNTPETWILLCEKA